MFTEHRDTLDYQHRKIGTLLGWAEAVYAIHHGVKRAQRRQITEQFTHNPDSGGLWPPTHWLPTIAAGARRNGCVA